MEERKIVTGDIPFTYRLVYNTTLEVLADYYNNGQQELAGQLAIAVIQYTLTGKTDFEDVADIRRYIKQIAPVINKMHEDYNFKKEITTINNSVKFEKIAEYLRKGYSQKKIAELEDVYQGTVSKWIAQMRKTKPQLLIGTKYDISK